MKTALIIGASGQTGAYLSRLLLASGYSVTGTSRNWAESQTWRLNRLGVLEDVNRLSLSLHDSLALEEALDSEAPEEIYYLAGPSSVAASFREPTTSMSEIFDPVVSLLEILKRRSSTAHFVNAASTDCFGNHGTSLLDERSPMKPVSPYGIAKTATYLTTQNYREAFGVDSRNAILTNHESPLRGPDFVTQKLSPDSGQSAMGSSRPSHWGTQQSPVIGCGPMMWPRHCTRSARALNPLTTWLRQEKRQRSMRLPRSPAPNLVSKLVKSSLTNLG